MKYGIYYAYWEDQWKADYFKYVEKVAKLGFDFLEIAPTRTSPRPTRRCAATRRSFSRRS